MIQIPENHVPILSSGRVHPSLEAHPNPHRLAGWLLEATATTALPEQLLLQPIWLEPSDPDHWGLQVAVALGIKPAPSQALGWGWGLLRRAGTPPAPPPHQHLSGIYRHRDACTIPPVQTSLAALETSCFSASRTTQEP